MVSKFILYQVFLKKPKYGLKDYPDIPSAIDIYLKDNEKILLIIFLFFFHFNAFAIMNTNIQKKFKL